MFTEDSIRQLLHRVREDDLDIDQAISQLRSLPFEQIDGFAVLDHHRELRCGNPEVIYCAGKSPQQVAEIAQAMAARSPRLLGTRARPEHFSTARELVPDLLYDQQSRTIHLERQPDRDLRDGIVLIAAGTSDLPVAEECARTLEFLGHSPQRIYDVGVAGLHRLLAHLPTMRDANVIIVCAGMEGALPSVVGGLASCPVIAVPTSVGYGASFGGLAALLGMLNSCASGIAVMNIDNGYGAAVHAHKINLRISATARTQCVRGTSEKPEPIGENAK